MKLPSMHKAAANGHLACLQLLSQRGGQLALADVTGFTPLHVAARNGHLSECSPPNTPHESLNDWLICQ